MEHISLETFNQLFAGKLSRREREALMDHVLECEMCAARFRVLKELDREMSDMIGTPRVVEEEAAIPRFRVPAKVKYALGVAAVMVMALTPYLTTPGGQPAAVPSATMARVEAPEQLKNTNVLDAVRQVNLQASLDHWSDNPDVRDLITKIN